MLSSDYSSRLGFSDKVQSSYRCFCLNLKTYLIKLISLICICDCLLHGLLRELLQLRHQVLASGS